MLPCQERRQYGNNEYKLPEGNTNLSILIKSSAERLHSRQLLKSSLGVPFVDGGGESSTRKMGITFQGW